MITQLTKEQEEGITLWREHCIKIGRDTSPINKELTEKSFNEFYEILKKDKPLFWYCQSPMQAQIIINIFSRQNINENVGHNINDNIEENIWQNIAKNVTKNIMKNIAKNIRHNIWQNIKENVEESIWESIWQNIGHNIGHNIGRNIGDNIRLNIEENIEENQKINFINVWLWGQHDINWIAYYKYYEKFGLLPYDENFRYLNIWYDLAKSCGWCYAFEKIVFVCEKPSKLHLNSGGMLHNANGLALEYSDGYGLWMLNGVNVPSWLVTTPAEQIDPKELLTEKNVEIRREIVRKIGIERIIQKLGAVSLDKANDYEVMKFTAMKVNNNHPVYFKMKNPSIGVWHVEEVPHTTKTVKEALHFRKPKKLQEIPVDDENGADWYQQGDVCIYPKDAPSVKFSPKILT